jgi:hypothetical protein
MGGLSSLFKSKSSTTTLEPMLTAEQKQALSALSAIGQGSGVTYGNLGDFNFGMTGVENMGQDQLMALLSSGTGSDMSTASRTLQEMANQKFNPDDPSSGFAAYSRQVARAGKTASDQLNQEAAITGSRFGTGIQRQKTDLAAQMSDQLGSKLGELYGQTQNQKLSAASGLGALAQAQEQMNQNRITAAYTYGARERDLQNQKAQLAYDDWQRARTEKMNSLSSVANANIDWGMKSYTTKTPSLFSQFAGKVLDGVGSALGSAAGGAITGGLSSFFSPSTAGLVGNTGKTQSQILGFNTANYR